MPQEYIDALNGTVHSQSNSSGNVGRVEQDDVEFMRNVAFLSKEFGFTYQTIIDMPYAIFLSYLRWGKQFKLEENPEFLKRVEDTKMLKETTPDIDKLRNLKL